MQHNAVYVAEYDMKIYKTIYDRIIYNSPIVPPESGGILGGNKNVITNFMFDYGQKSNRYDEYMPNVDLFNQTINQWQKNNIRFYGIYHCHFPNGNELSNGDKRYIFEILNSVPLKTLYFPIVFPHETMIAWRAQLIYDQLILSTESIELIN